MKHHTFNFEPLNNLFLIFSVRWSSSEKKNIFQLSSTGFLNEFLNIFSPIFPLQSNSVHMRLFVAASSATMPCTLAPTCSRRIIAWTTSFAKTSPQAGPLEAKKLLFVNICLITDETLARLHGKSFLSPDLLLNCHRNPLLP